jgi:hypothetical protein
MATIGFSHPERNERGKAEQAVGPLCISTLPLVQRNSRPSGLYYKLLGRFGVLRENRVRS